MSEEKNEALVPVNPAVSASVQPMNPFVEVFAKAGKPEVCSFDLKTPAGRQLLQKCEESSDLKVLENAGKTFRLKHVYAKTIDYTNEQTGETYPLLRICLVDADDRVLSCCSDGVREGLWRLMKGHGFPPWKDGIPVEVGIKKLGGARQRITLLEVFPSAKGKGAA
jgi:hypothetical protein